MVEHPFRRRPVHGVVEVVGNPILVAVTVCTKNRQGWLADQAVHDLLVNVWRGASAWAVGRYVLMPDHLHLYAGMAEEVPLDNWVRYWKSQFTKRHGVSSHRWQTDHWDRRARSAEEYEDGWNYMNWNPVRAGLVEAPEQWPFSGTIHDLRWD